MVLTAPRILSCLFTLGLVTALMVGAAPGAAGSTSGLITHIADSNADGLGVDGSGNVYIADTNRARIRRVDGASGVITTIAGTGLGGFCQPGDGGPATSAMLNWPEAIAIDGSGNVYIADYLDHRVRRVDAVTGIITTIAGTSTCTAGYSGDGGPATQAKLEHPRGIAIDDAGNIYIAEQGSPTHVEGQADRIRRVDAATGIITTFAGTGENGFSGDGGPATQAKLAGPRGLAVDSAGNLFIADGSNYRIRRVDAVTGIITTIAGAGAPSGGTYVPPPDGTLALEARFNPTHAVEVDDEGNVYISLAWNGPGVYKVDATTGTVLTIPGTGGIVVPALAADEASSVFIADSNGPDVGRVLKVEGPNCDETGVGLVDPSEGRWHLCTETGKIVSFYFGNPNDIPFMGDWDCDGIQTPGLYRQSDGFVYLRNSNTQGVADITFFFGNPGDIPIAGDFNNNGCDTVSIYRPSNQTFYIINKLGEDGGGLGAAEFSYVFGNPGDKPFVGDFNGNGIDTVGLHRESTGFVYFRNTHTQGVADKEFFFGNPGDRFVAGDWNGDGVDSPAVFRPSNTIFYFRHSNTQGNADSLFMWGSSVWLPVAGNFSP